ncbi:MAG TPA: UbiA prenyltransferase family protein [Myxococcota bacterium]|nr:UbiA prenyltransferase family protein [Myxococcota bacterium]
MKNLFVLAPLLFARHLFDWDLWLRALAAAALFSAMSSAVYAFNDALDVERDRSHPLKRGRPIAAGRISVRTAFVAAGGLALAAVLAGLSLGAGFVLVGLGYLGLNAIYSLWLKRVAFLDVACIATGFLLRVVGGALAIEAAISAWVVVCTFGLASLLGLGKRRHELVSLGDSSVDTRPALLGYSRRSLRVAEWVLVVVTVAAYAAYTLAPGTLAKFGHARLLLTVPFPLAGMLRYLQLVETRRDASPTEALVTDLPTWLNLAAWVVAVVIALYG